MPTIDSEYEVVTVASGARSLRSLAHGETFHPVVGPMIEARALHVEQQRLVQRASEAEGEFVIWDVGLGAAANAIAVIEAFRVLARDVPVALHSFEVTTAPLAFALENAEALGYVAPHRAAVERLLAVGEASDGAVAWTLHLGDFRARLDSAPAPHAILYDPYSLKANPELWTLEHFAKIAARLDPGRGCLWSNYTRSTAVRVTLLLAGFFVGRGAATGEKDETTMAGDRLELIERPFGEDWLTRVRRSTAAAPLRAGAVRGPIGDEDWEALLAHPQFASRATGG